MRAYALRAMAGIRLHVVAPLVLAAIGKCARDPSPYVRKCAAHALTKLHDLHLEENDSALVEVCLCTSFLFEWISLNTELLAVHMICSLSV